MTILSRLLLSRHGLAGWEETTLPSGYSGVGILCQRSACVGFSGGPDLLNTDLGWSILAYMSSVLVQRLLLPLRHLTLGHLGCKSRGCKS